MNREYFFHQSLTEIYRVRDALHIGEVNLKNSNQFFRNRLFVGKYRRQNIDAKSYEEKC